MAVVRVQGAGTQSVGTVASRSVTLGSPTTTGNRIVVGLAYYNIGTPAITVVDNKGNTYTQLGGLPVNYANYRVTMFTCASIVGGAGHQVTANSVGNSYLTFGVAEVSGTSGPPAVATGTGSGTTQTTGPLSAAAGDYLFGAMGHYGPAAMNPGAGWSEVYEAEENASNLAIHTEDRVAAGAGALTPTWTTSVSVTTYFAIGALFPGGGAAGLAAARSAGSNVLIGGH